MNEARILVLGAHSVPVASLLLALLPAFFYGLWFGFTSWRRAHPEVAR